MQVPVDLNGCLFYFEGPRLSTSYFRWGHKTVAGRKRESLFCDKHWSHKKGSQEHSRRLPLHRLRYLSPAEPG